ncbi:2,4-dihydroxyhept-2-ene-1,7-dioic acid aldolase [Amycolatopsis sp. K13G38]|uniref:2,4-dihydroxyhept-2-ene-1,7-dioic acid aldolase n=1 Tax=Amycolatopsis acididurans TaxID=2724524 RepID=A0ABX1JCV8_9PSEU|nr:aldolase/citrate lyase family protein [Amycolatopsis acididurans]NKQ56107.1 2,4-dihydroxyhept-2-ene-1,7-dioic acid aldolase [Amycolatopsis acididurans]
MNNQLRQLLEAPAAGHGISVNIPDPVVVELVGLAGFDFVFIDLEHSSIGLERLEYLLRTAKASGLATLVRTPGPRSELTARIVDSGADGVLIPQVESVADADYAVQVTRFPPLGRRGIAEASRTMDYGAHRGEDGRLDLVNRTQVLGVMIETAGAVRDIDGILRLPGLDFVFIGPEDLAASMGFPGERGHPDVEAAVRRVIKAVRAAGLRFAMGAGHPAVSITREELADGGASLVLAGRDSNVLLGGLRELRAKGGSGNQF